MDVIVEYDYSANESDELTIKKGDIIRDVIKKPGGWWEGLLHEKRGLFPDNFVRLMDKDSAVILRNKKDVSSIRQCRVIFSYKPDHQDELGLNVGDIINIIGEEEEGWWRGLLNGKEGVFPSNFVEEIKSKSSREDLRASSENIEVPKVHSKPSKILCQVKYSYKAQNEDELSIKEGDIINVLSKEGLDPGWWRGELNGQIGVFPDNFVTIISSADDKVNNDDSKIVKPTDSTALKPGVCAQRKSIEAKQENVNDNKVFPPIPSKKPLVPIKKSPSAFSSQTGILAGLKKKIVDAVDGSTGSKNLVKSTENLEKEDAHSLNAFDQVERNCMLSDVRATRAKAPGRRPPSVIIKDGELGSLNGNIDHFEIENAEISLGLHSPTNNKLPDEIKPKLRGWEKHKAPWLEEMKLNQAKRTSTSPNSEQSKLKLTPSENIPQETDSQIHSDKILSVELPSLNVTEKNEIINNETDKATVVLRNKPSSSVRIASSPPPSNQKPPIRKKTKVNDDNNVVNISGDQYNDLLDRLEELEFRFQQQEQIHKAAIEDIQNKLQVETDMRRMLQAELDKVSQCVQV